MQITFQCMLTADSYIPIKTMTIRCHFLTNKIPSKCVKPVSFYRHHPVTREAPGSLSVSKSSDSSAHDCFRKSLPDPVYHPISTLCILEVKGWNIFFPTPSFFFQVWKDPFKSPYKQIIKTYQNIPSDYATRRRQPQPVRRSRAGAVGVPRFFALLWVLKFYEAQHVFSRSQHAHQIIIFKSYKRGCCNKYFQVP